MFQAATDLPRQDGMSVHALPPGLKPGSPDLAGLDTPGLDRAFAVLEADIQAGYLPGAVAVVARGGVVAAYRALGWAQLNPDAERRPMQTDTLFDLASLTKVMATLPAALQLLEQGAFRLDDPLRHFFPEFTGDGKEQVRLRHLLTHTGGLQPWLPLEQEEGSREERIQRILTAPLQAAPGTQVIYTDLGYILLGELVSRLTGQPLDQVVRERVYLPLGLPTAGYNPPDHLHTNCAATEYREHLGRHQCGEVHDERATCLGGVAGHAGLFASAAEVAAYGQLWLNGGAVGDTHVLAPATVAAATRDLTPGLDESRGLGWIVLRPGAPFMSAGDLMAPGSFGHTGFTGTSLWIDPARQLVVAVLTNRVHLGRQDHIIRLRPRFHNAVLAAVR